MKTLCWCIRHIGNKLYSRHKFFIFIFLVKTLCWCYLATALNLLSSPPALCRYYNIMTTEKLPCNYSLNSNKFVDLFLDLHLFLSEECYHYIGYIIDRLDLFLTCNVAFKLSPNCKDTISSTTMMENRWTRNQSETTNLIGWFQSGDQNGSRVRTSQTVSEKLLTWEVEHYLVLNDSRFRLCR